MTARQRTGVAGDAGDRLKEELRHYLEARAELAMTSVGERLGEATRRLGDPGTSLGSALGPLSKGGKALAEGASPGRAMASAALSQAAGGIKGKVSGLLGALTGRHRRKGGAKAKSVVVIEDIDVGVPIRQAYDQWTQFQQFGSFAKGVVDVDKEDEVASQWQVKVAKANRAWKAKILEQVPDERIVWTSEGGKGTTRGAVTFHPLGDNLTKVLLVLEYFPKGLVEKTGNIWRAQGRRARLDLKLFRKFVTLQDEPAEGWRGEIRDGEVVRDHEEGEGEGEYGEEEEEYGEGEPMDRDETEEEEAGDEDEEPYEEEDEEDEQDEEEPPYEEERPRRRRAASHR